MRRRALAPGLVLLASAILLEGSAVSGQTSYGYRLGRPQADGEVTYRLSGVPIYSDALDPTVARWYLPPSHFDLAGRRGQWEYSNFASESYLRYVNQSLEGFFYYDGFGNLVDQGWVIVDWRQSQPSVSEGSQLLESPRFDRWFDRLLIASDVSGGRGYSILAGDEVFVTLTPMTFRKAGFNGLVGSYVADRFRATGVFSRITDPLLGGLSRISHFTNLMGGRALVDVSDRLTLGATFVNSHNNTATNESFQGNPFKGFLNAEELSQRLELLIVRLTDDSPEDGEGGAILFSDDVEIHTTIMRPVPGSDTQVLAALDTVILGSDVGFRPQIDGGQLEGGFPAANGADQIVMRYPLAPGQTGVAATDLRSLLIERLSLPEELADEAISGIRDIRFRLVLANDYRVDVASNRQTDETGIPQFTVVTRAQGNVKSRLNQRELVFDYGLPTANQIFGLTAEIRDFHGLDVYAEGNLNTRYRKYPTITRDKHRAISGIHGDEHAFAFMVDLSWRNGPWSVRAEGFGMEEEYTTSVRPVRLPGLTNYDPEATNVLYDFVEDNDDNDRHPDQLRLFEASLVPDPRAPNRQIFAARADPEVFPGFDENGDFISDFNQNNLVSRPNFFPDYDEPFLRFRSDRPEFLFGIDLNNNGWAERFENDHEPDYPHKKDHWGYNLYGGVEIVPRTKFRVGRLQEEMRKNDLENVVTYGLLTFDRDLPRGRIRIFDMLKRAEDTIPDHLFQWLIPRTRFGQAAPTSGVNQAVRDHLAAENTWINTFYSDYRYDSPRGWGTFHRFKWENWRQREADKEFLLDEEGNRVLDEETGEPFVLFDPLGPEGRNGRENSGFVGLINKVEYLHRWGRFEIDPRFKSEFLDETPFSRTLAARRSWDALLFLQLRFPVLRLTEIQAGWEQRFFYDLQGDEEELPTGQLSGDFRGSALALQLTNQGQYLGYRLTTQLGVRLDVRSLEVAEGKRRTESSGLTFLSILAGIW